MCGQGEQGQLLFDVCLGMSAGEEEASLSEDPVWRENRSDLTLAVSVMPQIPFWAGLHVCSHQIYLFIFETGCHY